MTHHDEHQEHVQKLWSLIKNIKFGMLTTVDEDGTLRSRPMATQSVEFDGDLWFFTYASSPKMQEVRHDQDVNVSFADNDNNVWVSVSGTGQIVRDRQKMEELWNPILKTWFPKGLEEPDIALLKVNVTKAEYWDSPSNPVVHAYGFIKSQLTGKPPSPGENEKIDLEQSRG
jgi:general stress protein 26